LPNIAIGKGNSISGSIILNAIGGGSLYTGDTNSATPGVFFIGTTANSSAAVTSHRFAVDSVNSVVHIGGYRRSVAVDGLLTSSYATGTDTAGSALLIAGGRGTGTGLGGSIKFQTAPAGTTGSSLNALVDRLTIDSTGSVSLLNNSKIRLENTTGYEVGTRKLEVILGAPWVGQNLTSFYVNGDGLCYSYAGFEAANQSSIGFKSHRFTFEGGWGELLRGSSRTNGSGIHLASVYNIGLSTAANYSVQLINSTNSQSLQIYNTFTSSTNNEFLQLRGVAGANFEIGPQNGSSGGTLRGLTIGGYVNGSSTITPWMSFTSSGIATMANALAFNSGGGIGVYNGYGWWGVISSYDPGNTDRPAVVLQTNIANTFNSSNTSLHWIPMSAQGPELTLGTGQGVVTTNIVTSASPISSARICGGSGSGTNIIGTTICIAGGRSTGSGLGGSVKLQTASAGSSGTSLNALVDRLTLDSTGLFTFNDGSNLAFGTSNGTKIGTNSNQKIGFWNANPVVQDTGWSTTNSTSTKTIDANNTNLNEVVNLLSTLINTLKTYGIIGA
jgi:hypothetical protein